MVDAIETCRHLWNIALEDRRMSWENEGRCTTYNQQCSNLPAEVRTNPLLKNAYAQSLQDVLRRLDKAFRAFLAGNSNYPRFKRRRDYGSFSYPQAYRSGVKLDIQKKRILLSKIGEVRIVVHRPVPLGTKLKTCTVEREPDGRWFACLLYDDVVPPQNIRVPASWKSPIGIDLGLKSLITTSDGEEVEPPKFLRKAEKKLKRLQMNLSRKETKSMNRVKARRKLAVQHSKVANQRKDHSHKLSTRLVRDHDLIIFEDLRILNLARNHTLAKSINDAGWGQLELFLEYKSKLAGKMTASVPPEYSTQECYFCGAHNQISLNTRGFVCKGCLRVLKRDSNAARVVLKRGILQVGQDKGSSSPRPGEENPNLIVPELKPVETEPLLPSVSGAASLVVEAGTKRDWNSHPTAGSPGSSNVGGCHKAGALTQLSFGDMS